MKQANWLKKISELENLDIHRRTRKFFQLLGDWRGNQHDSSGVIQSPEGQPSTNRTEYLEYWSKFYALLYDKPGTPPFESALAKLRNRKREGMQFPKDPLNQAITRNEFDTAVEAQRADAAAGADEISPKIIKNAPTWLLDHIFVILKLAWETEAPLECLKKVILAPLLKDPDKDTTDPGNYRPIALLMALLKLFETMVQKRLSDFFEGMLPELNGAEPIFSDATTGFRPARSTLDNILTIKELCLDYRLNQKRRPLWLCFMDIRKAFDTVNRDILWDTLWKCGVRGKMWRILRILFSSFKGSVRAMGMLSPEFDILRGVIQGSRLGPILFNIFFTAIINRISDLPGAEFSFGLKVTILTYADDIILLASSREDLQRLVNVCFSHACDNGYQYAPTKCKVIVLHRNYDNLVPIFLGENALEFVHTHKYLGIDFEKRNLNFSAYLKATVNKTRLRSISLSAIGIQRDGLRALTARRVYQFLVRPLIEYSAQVLHYNITTTKALERVQMAFYRKVFGTESKTPHAVQRLVAGVEPVASRAAKLKLKHYEKIRYSENRFLGPIVRQPASQNRGYVSEIRDLHTKWGLDPTWELAEKLSWIEHEAWNRDLEKMKALTGEHSCYLLLQQYNRTPVGKYTPNNVLNTLDSATREERGSFLRFLMGFSPALRLEACAKCDFAYDFSQPVSSPAVHLISICPHFDNQRKKLIEYVNKTLTEHHNLLGDCFKNSMQGDGILASAILMGCNEVYSDSDPGTASFVFRKLGKLRKHEPKTAPQIDKIVPLTAKFVREIIEAHKVPQSRDH